jgi:hypothetical protein
VRRVRVGCGVLMSEAGAAEREALAQVREEFPQIYAAILRRDLMTLIRRHGGYLRMSGRDLAAAGMDRPPRAGAGGACLRR